MHLEGWQWILGALGAFLVGVSKTGIAGLGILNVAIFSAILPARESVGVVLVILISADIVAVTTYRNDANWHHLWRLFPWAGFGVLIGAATMGRINDLTVKRLIGGILVILVLLHLWRRNRNRNRENPAIKSGTDRSRLAILAGICAGFTTMVANAAGPIMILYLLAMRLPKMEFIGTSAWFFLVLNLFKVPFSYSLGLINPASLSIDLPLAPFAMMGAVSGRAIIKHIDQSLFEKLALVLTLVAGVRMLF
jgi:uncharacterized membrane protein YfcA